MKKKRAPKVSGNGLARYLRGYGSLSDDFRNFMTSSIAAKRKRRDQIKPEYDQILRDHDEVEQAFKRLERIAETRQLNVIEREEWDRLLDRDGELLRLMYHGEHYKLSGEIMAAELFLCHMDSKDAYITANKAIAQLRHGTRLDTQAIAEELPYIQMN